MAEFADNVAVFIQYENGPVAITGVFIFEFFLGYINDNDADNLIINEANRLLCPLKDHRQNQ